MRTKLTADQVQQKLAATAGWTLENGEITRTFQLPSFPAAIVFVGAVAQLAEAADHHPDILIKWRTVKLALSTHDVGGITDTDFALAAQIDALPQRKS
jgi:4a-hydroxytetrahydrobiopterin dehydratase